MARVLVVDDDNNVLKLVEKVIQKHSNSKYKSDYKLRITKVTSTDKAVEFLNKHNYELVIADIMVARENNWKFLQNIRKGFSRFELPIIVTSAIDGDDLSYQCLKHGACSWFTKPLPLSDFSKEVFTFIEDR